MDAVISGHAGVALLLDGKKLSSIHFGGDGEALPRRPSEISLLFAGAGDLRLLKNVKPAQVREQLDLESARIDALHLALILLDADLSDETRRTAAEELEEELADQGIASWLEGVLYAHPLPASADLLGAYSACIGSTERTRALLFRLESLQAVIKEVHNAWQAVPLDRFGTEKDRQHARSVAVQAGLFRHMVADRAAGRVEDFIFEIQGNPALREIRDSRHVLLDWVAAFRKPREVRSLPATEVPDGVTDRDEEELARPRVDVQSVLSQVEWRKSGIVEAMRQRDLEQVRQDVEALISFQLEHGEPVHACKSLCDLAMRAKALGLVKLQLDLTVCSIRLKDDAAWSWTQHGDALLCNGRFNEALKAYDSAILFGERLVARNGRAEVLKSQNRLSESLAAYESVILDFPENVVARNGQACVLAALNRPLEALAILPASAPAIAEDWIGYHIRGMVLLRMGRLDEAVEIFQEGMEHCPRPTQRDYFRTAFAVSCLQRKTYSMAADALSEVVSPQLENTATLLRFHAYAGAGDLARAAEEDRALAPVVSLAKFKEIQEELRRRFVDQAPPQHTEEWLIESETDLLLAAA
jgi:tetratricopeptide (TPR) repeat protein